MATVERAIALACRAHEGQRDKAGSPYILHPLRLMLKFSEPELQMIAVLHDSVEDSELTLADLRQEGFSAAAVAAIDALTHRAEESYETYIERLAANPQARRVKIEDLKDNLNLTRLTALSDRDIARLRRYHRVLRRLEGD